MALPDGHDDAVLYAEEQYIDSYGNASTRPGPVGIPIKCNIRRLARTPAEDLGLGEIVGWRFVTRDDVPIGRWSKIEWRGKTLCPRFDPIWHDRSQATRRVTAILVEMP